MIDEIKKWPTTIQMKNDAKILKSRKNLNFSANASNMNNFL